MDKNNIFYKSSVAVVKVVVLAILAYYFVELFFVSSAIQLAIGLFILVFITLPTIFIIFFKQKWNARHPRFAKWWKVLRIFYAIIVILFIGSTIFGIWHLNQLAKTQKAIDFINSKKITLDDVMGKNLPTIPDQKINDSSIAGIDANNNYIRDDVELAIFKKYPNSAKIRAAELQYAQALQLELTQVFDSPTLVAVLQKEGLAYQCLGAAVLDKSKTMSEISAIIGEKDKEINNLAINTDLRAQNQQDIYKKYMTSYMSSSGNECDIELTSLPN
ncbi:MAG: hypothetical protein NT026_00510 [Candidatus Staskawiczbacteria bacterium]|nr:hypothetical protein [Candidatus Staskawiczbacteria bacterium]